MAPKYAVDRPTYQGSGRVAWPRFLPVALAAPGVAAGMAYLWFLAYDAGLGYWIATPVVLVLPVALAVYLAVLVGHCRNRVVAVALGTAAALVFHLGYFHADLVSRNGPQALLRLDLLPEFIGDRMANDAVRVQNQVLPRGELYNWFYSATELLVIALIIDVVALMRAQKAYCESCHRWMKSIGFNMDAGTATEIADALEDRALADIPVTEGRFAPFRGPHGWLDFEYCPGLREAGSGCVAYLTLREFTGTTETSPTLLSQGRLTAAELDAMAQRVSALAFLRVSAPTAAADELAVARSIERHVGPVSAVERLPDHAGGADLDRAGKVEFLLALVPVSALLAGIGLSVWGAVGAGPAVLGVGLVLALAGGVVCRVNVDLLGIRYMAGQIRGRIRQRPDALVSADDPAARFVDVVPRAQWHQFVPDKPTDRGLLAIDRAGGRLLFEGLRERYVIPAEAIVACEVEPMLPHTGSWNLYVVVLTVRYPVGAPASVIGGRRGDEWEIPLLPRTTEFRRYSSAVRHGLAESLREQIEQMPGGPRGRDDRSD